MKTSTPKRPTLSMFFLGLMAFLIGYLKEWELLYFVAIIFLFIGIFLKGLSLKILKWWIRLGELLGRFLNPVFLGLFYFLFLTPIAILFRFFKKESLMKIDRSKNSYYEVRNKQYQLNDLKEPW